MGEQCIKKWLTPGETKGCPSCRHPIAVPPALPRRCPSCSGLIDTWRSTSWQAAARRYLKQRLEALAQKQDDSGSLVICADRLSGYLDALTGAVNLVYSTELLDDTPIRREPLGYYNPTTSIEIGHLFDVISSELQKMDGQTYLRDRLLYRILDTLSHCWHSPKPTLPSSTEFCETPVRSSVDRTY